MFDEGVEMLVVVNEEKEMGEENVNNGFGNGELMKMFKKFLVLKVKFGLELNDFLVDFVIDDLNEFFLFLIEDG